MMSHIDEGALHAYLDGALEEYPTSERERVREHLDICEVCRERLEAERTIRDRAAAILGGSTPRVDVPSFEELRAHGRARTVGRGTASARLRGLGWAASVILALGVGWMLRGGPILPGTSVDDPARMIVEGSGIVPTVEALTRSEVDTDGSGEDVGMVAETSDPAPTRAVDQAQPPDARLEPSVDGGLLPSRTDLSTVTVALDDIEDLDDAEVLPELGGSAPPLPEAPPVDPSVVPGVDVVADAGPAAGVPDRATPREPTGSPREVVTSASRAAELPGVAVLGRAADESRDSRDEAEDEADSYSLVVPGLFVMDVRFRGGVEPEGQVVLQRLASGDTLEVIHLPPEVEPSSLEMADPVHRQLVLRTASGWVVMRAPVGEDELRDLMGRLFSVD